MKARIVALVALLFVPLLLSACFAFEGLAYEQDLVGDYAVWAVDTRAWTSVVKKDKPTSQGQGGSVVIDMMVFAYGWNEDFIIAKQHPNPGQDPSRVNTEVTNWYILKVETGKVHGPLTEQEFAEMRRELGVPAVLTFTKTVSISQEEAQDDPVLPSPPGMVKRLWRGLMERIRPIVAIVQRGYHKLRHVLSAR